MGMGHVGMVLNTNDAAQIAIIEMLVNPEYSREWLLELAEMTFGKDPDEAAIDEIERVFLDDSTLLARNVVENILDPDLREKYRKLANGETD